MKILRNVNNHLMTTHKFVLKILNTYINLNLKNDIPWYHISRRHARVKEIKHLYKPHPSNPRYPTSHPRAEQTRGPSKTGKAREAKRENPSRPGRENEPSPKPAVRRLPFPINTEPPPPPPSPKPSPKPYSIRQLGFLAASTAAPSCRR
jgi:hypothetical protein